MALQATTPTNGESRRQSIATFRSAAGEAIHVAEGGQTDSAEGTKTHAATRHAETAASTAAAYFCMGEAKPALAATQASARQESAEANSTSRTATATKSGGKTGP